MSYKSCICLSGGSTVWYSPLYKSNNSTEILGPSGFSRPIDYLSATKALESNATWKALPNSCFLFRPQGAFSFKEGMMWHFHLRPFLRFWLAEFPARTFHFLELRSIVEKWWQWIIRKHCLVTLLFYSKHSCFLFSHFMCLSSSKPLASRKEELHLNSTITPVFFSPHRQATVP